MRRFLVSAVKLWYMVTWVFAFADFELGVLYFWDYISGVMTESA